MSVLERFWNRLRGRESDPTIGTQVGLVAGAVAVHEVTQEGETDHGWSGDHMDGSDFGGGSGGFDGGAGGDVGGGF
jgi:hypothetical protein